MKGADEEGELGEDMLSMWEALSLLSGTSGSLSLSTVRCDSSKNKSIEISSAT